MMGYSVILDIPKWVYAAIVLILLVIGIAGNCMSPSADATANTSHQVKAPCAEDANTGLFSS